MTKIFSISHYRAFRIVAAMLFSMAGAISFASIAQADERAADAGTFIQQSFEKGFAELNNGALSAPDRRQRFHQTVMNLIDVRDTAYYALGASAAKANPKDMDAFVSAFRDYTVASYEDQLGTDTRPTLQVTGLQSCGGKDFLVTARVVRPGSSGMTLTFRVRNPGLNKYAVVDVQVSGIWMSVIKRAEFASFLYLNGGSVPKLADHLAKATENIRSKVG